jgi:hypothetical protein
MQLYQTSRELLYNLEATSSSEAKRKWVQSIKDYWGECAYCGSKENLTLDHIIPKINGGKDKITNMLCACHSCNQSKGHQMWSKWYLQQTFFTTERLSDIIEWQKRITDTELVVYKPRKMFFS